MLNPSGKRTFQAVRLSVTAAVLLAESGCKPRPSGEIVSTNQPGPVRGAPIAALGSSNKVTGSNAPFVPADYSRADKVENGLIHLGWDKLSGFKFDVYEFYPESHVGRPLLKSDDTIPAPMKAYDGNRVLISGFVLPLRTRKGRVTEFLLLRDQGTCCFGARAQINHFIRVKYAEGIQPTEPMPWQVTGTLRVGEIFVQGYLTGIYEMEAESARETSVR